MAEEPQAPAQPDTPTQEAPAEQDTSQVVDYQKRYNDLRPEFDAKSQQLAEQQALLSDPERLAAYWQEQGYELPEEDDTLENEPVYEDPRIAELEKQQAELAEWRDSQQQQAQQAAEHEFVSQQIETIEEKLGQDLPQKVANWIGNLALQNRDEAGRPDVEKAYEEYRAVVDEERESWVKTKKVPSRPGKGSAAATETVDKSTRKGRLDAFQQAWNEQGA